MNNTLTAKAHVSSMVCVYEDAIYFLDRTNKTIKAIHKLPDYVVEQVGDLDGYTTEDVIMEVSRKMDDITLLTFNDISEVWIPESGCGSVTVYGRVYTEAELVKYVDPVLHKELVMQWADAQDKA